MSTSYVDLPNELFALTMIIVVGLLLRLMQFIRFNFPGGSDVFFHLSYIRNINEFFEKVQPYPYLFHVLSRKVKNILRLPDSKLILIGIVPDVITGLIGYFFIRHYFDAMTSLVVLALFLTTPVLVYQSVFGPRSLGLLMYTSSLLASLMPFPLNTLSILFISLTALTHKLSLQTLFFVVLSYSFFDISYVLYFVLGFLLALLISKFRYYRVFRSHLSYVKLMVTEPRLRHPNRECLAFTNVPYAIIPPLHVIFLLAGNISQPILSFFNFPVDFFWYQPMGRFFLIWGLVTFALVFFWRWGDSHKYVSFGSLPLALLVSEALMSNGFLRALAPIMILGNVILSLYITRRNTLITETFLQAVDFLSKVLDDGFCCPQRYYWAVKYFTNGKGGYIDTKNRVVKPRSDEVNHFQYIIIPSSMISNFKFKKEIETLFSNEEWIVGRL